MYPMALGGGGRQRGLGQQILELRSRAAFTKRSSTADEVRTAQALPELSPADCNRTGCVFRYVFYFQRYCTEKKKVTFLSHQPPASCHSCLLQSPAESLQRDGTHAKASFVSVVSTRLLC